MLKNLKTTVKRVPNYFIEKDEWIFVGLILVYSLAYTQSNQWSEYLNFVWRYTLELSPILIFKYFQPYLKNTLNKSIVITLWFLVFVIYLLILGFSDQLLNGYYTLQSSKGDILLTFFIVELMIMFNGGVKSNTRIISQFNKIGLDRGILLLLFIFSIYFGLLATSNLPLWYERNALEHPIIFSNVWQNLPMFLSLVVQIFCLYFIGFLLYWINRHVLIKRILAERGIIIYALSVMTCVALLYPVLIELYLLLPINRMGEPIIPAETANAFDWINARVALIIIFISLPVVLFSQWNKKNIQFIQLEKEKSQNELELLKQQINPHFFFNTLNNLYALCLKKSDLAADVVIQLSELMRYVVYQGKKHNVAIKHEAKYIQDYINLQNIRLSQKMDLETNIQIDEPEIQISPLLLIILVENAFKHGIEPSTQSSYLRIFLILKNKKLHFRCENSVDVISHDAIINKPEINQGIGLENLKKRLLLLYPNNHEITFKNNSDSFSAELNINLPGEDA